MSVQLVIAAISAVVSLASVLLSARTARSNTKFQAQLHRESTEFQASLEDELQQRRAQLQRENDEFQARLQDELQRHRDQASKAAQLEEVMNRYRDPLLSAAFELQSRIYNFVLGGFAVYLNNAGKDREDYAVNSTLFVMAQYFAWTEALRRGVQFLDLGDIQRSRDLADYLENIRGTFSTDTKWHGPLQVFRMEQRAIGELMLEPSVAAQSSEAPWQCIGYAAFCSRILENQSFASWFARLDQEVRGLATRELSRSRLSALQNCLIDLIDFLDTPPLRFPLKLRSRIPLANG